jgi:hypothetical protein
MEKNGLLDFLKTKRSKKELKLCLDILTEFKKHESKIEWVVTPFDTWAKLEQFEEYLKLLTNTNIKSVTDEVAKEFLKNIV